jgi:hypothetical protein
MFSPTAKSKSRLEQRRPTEGEQERPANEAVHECRGKRNEPDLFRPRQASLAPSASKVAAERK